MEYYQAVQQQLQRIRQMQQKIVASEVGKTGVYRSQHRILMYLSCFPEGSYQKEIAGAMGVSEAAITVSLRKMEKGGFVARSIASHDNRYHRVVLTDKGMAVVEDSKKIFDELDRQTFRGFDEERLRLFSECLTMMEENLAGHSAKGGGKSE